MLTIHLSNCLESLLDLLAGAADAQSGDVFTPLTLIVPSAAIQRATTLHLADRWGICANVEFHFPASWIWRQIARAVPRVASDSPFDPDVLVWRVYRVLGDTGFVATHPRLAAYLGRADDVMRFDLAARSASLLEQYITYRPDWMSRWAKGELAAGAGDLPPLEDEPWQAALWQRIASDLSLVAEHPAHTMIRLLEEGHDIGLPGSISLIAPPAMPPLYIELLQQLGRWMDVRVYVLNPCRAYWFDVVGKRRLSWLTARGQSEGFEQGHRLLADWGRQTQAFLARLLDLDEDAIVDDGRFERHDGDSLLAALQNSILDLEELAPSSVELAQADRSVEVHVCHSATRELEALQDFLLGLFAADAKLSPSDILVVTPDLQGTAPLVAAVFGAAPFELRIPFTVTGLPERESNLYSRLLLDVLGFVRSRCGVTDLFALLQHEAVARQFGLDDAAREEIQAWMQAAGMHWALDGRHRGGFDLPASEKHSLDDGLQRLFLGYSLPESARRPFLDRLPAPGAEGSAARSLGALWAVLEVLRHLADQTAYFRPGGAWCQLLGETVDALASPSQDDLPDLLALRRSLHDLQERMAAAAADDPLPFPVVHRALQNLLEEPSRGGVPSGTVTFASLAGLRGVPYKVICVIGLNDGVVPSASSPCEFDLMALRPRAGDRQRRTDERNLFLDLILAARERLYLSHVGRSVRDNARIPPSILVSELLEHLVGVLALDEQEARRRLVVEHPLQPFATRSFTATAPRERSFDKEYALALRRALAADTVALGREAEEDAEDEEAAWDPRAPFFRQPLPPPDESWRDVPLARLLEFFRNPCRFLLRHRMSIELARPQERLDDDEPLLPEFDQRAALADRLLPHALAGASGDELRALARAGVEYPGGALGKRQIEAELALLEDFAHRVRTASSEPALASRRIEMPLVVDGATWRVHADHADLRKGGLVRYRYDDTRVVDYLAGWLPHLLLCAGAPAGVEPVTCWHSRDGSFRYDDVADPRGVLRELVALYARGLTRPLHFFPKSAWDCARKDMKLDAAQDRWQVTVYRPYAEGSDTAYALALRGVPEPLDDEFLECARTVFEPLLACLKDPRL